MSVSNANNTSMGTNTIQLQFQALSDERDAFRRGEKDASDERIQVERRIAELRSTQKQVNEEIHATSTTLGIAHRQHEMLKKELERLKSLLGEDRMALEKLVKDATALQAKRTDQKKRFCSDMEAKSQEFLDLLTTREERRWENMISPYVIDVLVSYYKGVESSPVGVDSGSLMEELEEAAAKLTEAYDRISFISKKESELQVMVDHYRSLAKMMPHKSMAKVRTSTVRIIPKR